MNDLISQETIEKNIKILKELEVGQKLYVDQETLELTIDDRNFQGLRRRENRYECLVPILLTFWQQSPKDCLNNLEKTYNNDFKQLEKVLKLIDITSKESDKLSKIKKLEEKITQMDTNYCMTNIDQENKIKELEKDLRKYNNARFQRSK